MNILKKQLEKGTKHIALTKDEKALMREHLVQYTEFKPLRTRQPVKQTSRSFGIPIFSYFRMHHISGALMIALLVTSSSFGVSLAAAEALPGEFLYGVKIHINEEVKSALLGSNEARIDWERERAEMRLTEAGQLAAEGKLDADLQEEVTRRFVEHTEAVVEQVLAIEEEDPALAIEVSSEFEAALDIHEAVLARLVVEQDGTVDEGERNLIEQVHTAASEAGKIREDAEERLSVVSDDETEAVEPGEDGEEGEDTDALAVEEGDMTEEEKKPVVLTDSANMRIHVAYQARLRAEEHLKNAEEHLTKLDPSSDLAAQAEAQIISGKALMAEGDAAVAEHELGIAYSAYRRAGSSFQKVAQLLEVANLFAIEIYPTVLPVPLVEENGEEAVPQEEGDSDEIVIDEETTNNMHSLAEDSILEAQTLLLTWEGYGSDMVERVNELIKSAVADLLRGEIALVLEEFEDAYVLFAAAQKNSGRASDLLTIAMKTQDVQEVEVGDEVPPVPEELIPQEIPVVPEETPAETVEPETVDEEEAEKVLEEDDTETSEEDVPESSEGAMLQE